MGTIKVKPQRTGFLIKGEDEIRGCFKFSENYLSSRTVTVMWRWWIHQYATSQRCATTAYQSVTAMPSSNGKISSHMKQDIIVHKKEARACCW